MALEQESGCVGQTCKGKGLDEHLSKGIVIGLNTLILLAVFLNWRDLIEWLQDDHQSSILLVYFVVVLLACIPGMPFGLVGGMIGAKYGLVVGGVMNITASTMSAVIIYLLMRYLFKDWGIKRLEKARGLRRVDEFLRKNVFWSILIGRLIPVMPAALINSYAGIFALSFKAFVIATFLGKIPFILVFTFAGHNLHSGAGEWLIIFGIYAVFLGVVYLGYRIWVKRLAVH